MSIWSRYGVVKFATPFFRAWFSGRVYVRRAHFSVSIFWNFLSFITHTISTIDTIFLHNITKDTYSEYFLGD